jgi:bifunctional non-homologous end joining protein LigD
VAKDLYRRLEPLRTNTSPFDERLTAEAARQVRYVRPELVAEIEFRNWTADENLRHASFRGLREDKAVAEIVQETTGRERPERSRKLARLTHPDRIYWPDAGVTKEGLAEYYGEVWRWIAPYVVGRPLALVRCPEGVGGQCFFQKHAWNGISRAIRQEADPLDPEAALLMIDDLDGLIGLVQAGVLEIHPWGAAFANLEKPDQIVIDLDPGEGVAWPEVIAAAIEVRERLNGLGLVGFVKTSGGKGLHVNVPLRPSAGWTAVKAFAKSLADAMAGDCPDRYVATVTKAKRRGRILVDYLRNGRGNTAVAPYSTRARAGAPVSMPLDWGELSPELGPAYFTVANSGNRLANLASDPWGGFRDAAAPLPKSKGRRRAA